MLLAVWLTASTCSFQIPRHSARALQPNGERQPRVNAVDLPGAVDLHVSLVNVHVDTMLWTPTATWAFTRATGFHDTVCRAFVAGTSRHNAAVYRAGWGRHDDAVHRAAETFSARFSEAFSESFSKPHFPPFFPWGGSKVFFKDFYKPLEASVRGAALMIAGAFILAYAPACMAGWGGGIGVMLVVIGQVIGYGGLHPTRQTSSRGRRRQLRRLRRCAC